jgi:hypothetical protein
MLVQTVCNKNIGKLVIAKIEMIVKSYKNDVRLIIVVQIIETTKKRIPTPKTINGVTANFFLFILKNIVVINPPIIAKNDNAVIIESTNLSILVAKINVEDFGKNLESFCK